MFADSRDQHLVPEGSKFDIKPGQSKFLYEMINPERLPEPIDASTTRGIVARNISQLEDKEPRPPASKQREGQTEADIRLDDFTLSKRTMSGQYVGAPEG